MWIGIVAPSTFCFVDKVGSSDQYVFECSRLVVRGKGNLDHAMLCGCASVSVLAFDLNLDRP